VNLRDYLYKAAWFSPVRILLSWIYGSIIFSRNLLYDLGIFSTIHIKTPVISIGNITVGGSGKTVLTQALIEYYISRKMTPAVLSRGYGRLSKGLLVVADKSGLKTSPQAGGDEPYMIAHNYPGVPVLVSEDRVAGARYLERHFEPDVILLDDGFQHRRMGRAFNILIIDSPDLAAEKLLPKGRLREPASSQKRADIVLFSKAGNRVETTFSLNLKQLPQVTDIDGNTLALDHTITDLGLFAGIGNHQHFIDGILHFTQALKAQLNFPDHVTYGKAEYTQIRQLNCSILVTTQKDMVKLDPDFCRENNIYYSTLKVDLPSSLLERLKQNFN